MINQVEVTVDGVEKIAKYGREYSDLIVADSWRQHVLGCREFWKYEIEGETGLWEAIWNHSIFLSRVMAYSEGQ